MAPNMNEELILEHLKSDGLKNWLGTLPTASRFQFFKGVRDLIRANASEVLDSTKGKNWPVAFNAFFETVSSDKATFLKATKTAKNTIRIRFAGYGAALKAMTALVSNKIEIKTARALAINIVEIIWSVDDGIFQPLSRDFIRSLSQVLEYQPHVEHLRDAWHTILIFCLDALNLCCSTYSEMTASSTTGRSVYSNVSISRDVLNLEETREDAGILLSCIKHLCYPPSSPLYDKGSEITHAVLAYLQSTRNYSNGDHDGMTVLNLVAQKLAYTDLAWSKPAVLSSVPILAKMWKLDKPGVPVCADVLVFLTHMHLHVADTLRDSTSHDFREAVERLLEVIREDYYSREPRQQLEFDDIILGIAQSPSSPPIEQIGGCRSSFSRKESESYWATVYILAYFSFVLDTLHVDDTEDAMDIEGVSRKRQRTSTQLDGILRAAASSQPADNAQSAALQVLSFYTSLLPLSIGKLEEILDTVVPLISGMSTVMSSWALLVLCQVALQKVAGMPSFARQWLQIWELATRLVPSSTTSRIACHALDVLLRVNLVPYSAVSQSLGQMLEFAELSGPAVLAESSVSFWISFLTLRQSENPSSSRGLAEKLLRWLFKKWTPSFFDDQFYSANACKVEAADILKLLSFAINEEFIAAPEERASFRGSIGQAWARLRDSESLLRYLLLVPEYQPFLIHDSFKSGGLRLQNKRDRTMSDILVESCIAEMEKIIQKLPTFEQDRKQGFTVVVLRLLATTCLVFDHIIALWQESGTERVSHLQSLTQKLTLPVVGYLGHSDCGQDKVDQILKLASNLLPKLTPLMHLSRVEIERHSFTLHLALILEDRKEGVRPQVSSMTMEIDDGFESQASQAETDQSTWTGRDVYSLKYEKACFRVYTGLHVSYLARIKEQGFDSGIPPSFFEHIFALSPADLCKSLPFILKLFEIAGSEDEANLVLFLEKFADNILATYEFESCETVISSLAAFLELFIEKWASDTTISPMKEVGLEIYAYLLNMYPDKLPASADMLQSMVRLIFGLLQSQGPHFQPDTMIPTVQSLIVKLLQSEIPVRWSLAQYLPRLFQHYTLGEHEAVFQELYSHMVLHEWNEGTATWLFMLAELASTWPTLQRRSIYSIFEWGSLYPSVIKYAFSCVRSISIKVSLSDEKELCRLHAPQILHAWMENYQLETVPFAVFGYASLSELFTDIEDEVMAQVISRGTEAELSFLSSELRESHQALLRRNFAKSTAYSICLEAPKHKVAPKSTGEVRIRTVLGANEYAALLQLHYPRIVAILFGCVRSSEEEQLIKKLARDPPTEKIGTKLTAMRDLSHSNVQLVTDQQPSFRAFALFDLLERVGRRTGRGYGKLWSPGLFVFVLRYLLHKIHPSMGSLYACASVRKIRIFLAFAEERFEKSQLNGYPLEMILGGLQPFLADSQCAEDTIGVIQYLLESSKSSLCTNISFTCGYMVSTLISLQRFLGRPQESTTQESHHRTTMTRTGVFRDWLAQHWYPDFLKSCQSTESNVKLMRWFESSVSRAISANRKTTARSETPESSLLLQLLRNRTIRSHEVLNSETDLLIFGMLLQDFDDPPPYSQDCLGMDENASIYATPLMTVTKSITEPDERFVIWAGRVLGRANNHGSLRQLPLATDMKKPLARGQSPGDPCDPSFRAITATLIDVLYRGNPTAAGLVEDFLRGVIRRSQDSSDALTPSDLIPRRIESALSLNANDHVIMPRPFKSQPLEAAFLDNDEVTTWVKVLASSLAVMSKNQFVQTLATVLYWVNGVAEKTLGPLLHIILAEELERQGNGPIKSTVSQMMTRVFSNTDESNRPKIRALLGLLLQLRHHNPYSGGTIKDRDNWLDLDFIDVARAAEACGMHTAALIFAESAYLTMQISQEIGRRKSALAESTLPNDLLLSIYKNIDEPDSFYGVHTNSSLSSVLERLDYENDGFKALLFHGAKLDSNMRRNHEVDTSDVLQAFSKLNLNSVTHALLQTSGSSTGKTVNQALQAAQKLDQWDIMVPDSVTADSAILFKVFQSINNSLDPLVIQDKVNGATLQTMRSLINQELSARHLHSYLRILGVLVEIDEVINCRSLGAMMDVLKRMRRRNERLSSLEIDSLNALISARDTLFGIIADNRHLQTMMHLSERDTLQVQVNILLDACKISQDQNRAHESLSMVTYLSDLLPACEKIGLDEKLRIQESIADILWAQNEQVAAIQILSNLTAQPAFTDPGRKSASHKNAAILAKLGHHVGEARLENPEEITQKYLEPALKDLTGNITGENAGQVLHEFAVFCDKQLSNEEFTKDLERVTKARERSRKEVEQYQSTIRRLKDKAEKDRLTKEYRTSKSWFNLNDEEYNRMATIRDSQVLQCLENYLRSLQAWDKFDSDALRFFSIWLENRENIKANAKTETLIPTVPTHKFAILMNQLTSILQDDSTIFMKTLSKLLSRICADHPFHSLHHIFAGTQPGLENDTTAISRKNAINSLVRILQSSSASRDMWDRVYRADTMYNKLAMYKDKSKSLTQGRQVPLDSLSPSATLKVKIKELRLPPATMNIPLRPAGNYSDLPYVVSFQPYMTIASGISAPKILTAIASDGNQYKQLYKSGNDDLRQDAIMEQVFEQVSHLLKNHEPTRRRRLHIRTYKVLPLSIQSGIIEFVKNTIPLSDYLHPAHDKYFPADITWTRCREKLAAITQQTKDPRSIIKVFRELTSQFHPVLHFFFLERFLEPEEWFQRRLAYTRSTAAISILGHILGLGDRHCHNILLDQQTGEAVHIDLGIAFESGKFLPVPEVVPFRLTRDIVSAMGYTKTNGIFKRCCEFTLDALRKERENIMTLLNVLRYDPLVTWTVSPLRAKQMQDLDEAAGGGLMDSVQSSGAGGRDKDEGRAGMALRVVEKKLSNVSSTAAVVSELIQQASDDRNLAVLYPGWAPWA